MQKKLFTYAALWHKEDSEGDVETELLIEPKTILASNDKSAATLVARALPEKCLEDLDNVEIIVRPF